MKQPQTKIPSDAISVDPESTLEQVIASVNGDTSKLFVVEQNHEAIGILSMHEIMVAIVPRKPPSELLDT
jgi:predicted transcriptional regulator